MELWFKAPPICAQTLEPLRQNLIAQVQQLSTQQIKILLAFCAIYVTQ